MGGCISSKFLATRKPYGAGVDSPNHVVTLTYSTYRVLDLDFRGENPKKAAAGEEETSTQCRRPPPPDAHLENPKEEALEAIDVSELMKGLEDGTPVCSPAKTPTRSQAVMHPTSPKKTKGKSSGKENCSIRQGLEWSDHGPHGRVLQPLGSSADVQELGSISLIQPKKVQIEAKISESNPGFSPLFDPELAAFFETGLSKEEELIKTVVVSPLPTNLRTSDLDNFEEKCPPGGRDAVVLYTTTLRGIKKTFQDCNAVRSVIESYGVRILERDVSMDSGFREELRRLMGKRDVRTPVLFVKGRLIGGAAEVLRLEEEGGLGLMLEGIPVAATLCRVCAGARFVLCADCHGSCKLLNEEEEKTVRCGECNENGLVRCLLCC